jgi:DNA-binding beta-propeller fold protein YncE
VPSRFQARRSRTEDRWASVVRRHRRPLSGVCAVSGRARNATTSAPRSLGGGGTADSVYATEQRHSIDSCRTRRLVSERMTALSVLIGSVLLCPGSAPVNLEVVRTLGPSLPDGGGMIYPVDAAVSAQGETYVLDQGRKLVLRIAPQGSVTAEFGGFGWDEGQMWEPACVALSPLGVYVTDPQQESVLKFDREGAFVRRLLLSELSDDLSLPLRPWGIAVGPGGEVFVTDSQNGLVLRLDFSDRVEVSFGVFGRGLAHMDQPRGIYVSADRRVYLCDSGNRRVQVLDGLGNVLYQWAIPGDGEPWDLAVDRWGYCFVTVPDQRRVLVFEPSGAPLLSWRPDDTGSNVLFQPLGVALGPHDLLYVVDGGSDAIVVLSVIRG